MPKKEKKKDSGGKFQWILFIVIIPLTVLIIVAGIILYIAGYDFKKPLQNIPVISHLVDSGDDSKTSSSNNDPKDTTIKELKQTMKEQKNELEIAQKDLKTSDEEIKRLTQKINSLEKTTEDTSSTDAGSSTASNSHSSTSNDSSSDKQTKGKVISIYESMDAGKSAKILAELSDKEALKILEELNKNKLTEILAKLTPQKAAKFTEELAKKEESANGGE
ncbi:MotE family protein [Bacillus sp. NPDC077027]|uniref:MotE family protein n=1 Tax=Bacillus sp. NPDC077027 TaxID=3390548 RepID=UPI003D04299B